jgi:KDO2-lipid IV(A) lauroyltransferase
MDLLLYGLARAVVALLQALPLPLVARLGRLGGIVAYGLDGRHRRVALRNLAMCFGKELGPAGIRALARENFRRLGENYASAVKTAVMSPAALQPYFEFAHAERILPCQANQGPQNRVVAIGHFGNFELYVRFGQFVPGFRLGSTYRALRQPRLNRLMQSLRERSGCRFFERRTEAAALQAAMSDTGLLLGLLADQHAGRSGRRLPFLGRECSTTTAPAVFALRYRCPLHTAVCYRVGRGRWRIEVGEEIPTHVAGQRRSIEEITADINRALEVAVRRDPANWFWVHDRWKTERRRRPTPQNSAGQPEPEPTRG